MAQKFSSYDKYRSDFAAFDKGPEADGPEWVRGIRAKGYSAFDRLEFPTAARGNEKWKYTNVTPVARATFEYPFETPVNGVGDSDLDGLVPLDRSWTRLVFVDGHFRQALSSAHANVDGPLVGSLAEAIQADDGLVREHLARYAAVEDDGFTAINTAFLRDGAFVYVPDNSSLPSTLHLVFASAQGELPTVSHPRTLVVAGRHARLTVVESYVGLTGGPYFTNAVTEIVAADGAEIEHYRYLAESPDAFHIGTTRVSLGRDSTFNSTSIARGARLARNDLNVLLDAPGSACNLYGLYVTSGTQHIDNHIDVDHARPHTTSDQLFKGILTGNSRAVFSGRVVIRPDAQKSYAKQADKNLMLSDGAKVNTKPSMEIFADDVKAMHGATAGAVAQDALFYMRSRGLDLETARSLLIYGFASEIIDKIRPEPLRGYVDNLFAGTLPGLQPPSAASAESSERALSGVAHNV